MTPAITGHVLIVEPNDISRKLLTGILAKNNYATYEARTSDEARGFLHNDLQIAVVDIENEDPELAGMLHKLQREKSRVMIVVMSEDTDERAIASRLRIPKVSILQKPVLPDRLMKLISDHRATEQAVKPGATGKYIEKDPNVLRQREGFMLRAIDLAQEKMDAGCGGPFGAVVVRNGKIVGEGWNAVLSTFDPTAHAEIMALRHASQELKTDDLSGCEIYTSCEPCPMCAAALYWAKIDRVFYACTREDAEKIGFDDDFIYREMAQPEHKRSLPSRMFLREDAKIVFDNWMRKEKARF